MPQDDGGATTGAPLGTTRDFTPGELVEAEFDAMAYRYIFTTVDGRRFRASTVDALPDGGYRLHNPSEETPLALGERPQFGLAARYTGCPCEMCRPRSLEAVERQCRLDEEREREVREQQRRRQEAEARAEETLRMILLPEELAEYDRTKRIVITGADGQRYRIEQGNVFNVALLDDRGIVLANLCCHPDMYPDYRDASGPLPMRDAHVAQILWLRHDLIRFYETANIDWKDAGARDRWSRRLRWRRLARARLRNIRRLQAA